MNLQKRDTTNMFNTTDQKLSTDLFLRGLFGSKMKNSLTQTRKAILAPLVALVVLGAGYVPLSVAEASSPSNSSVTAPSSKNGLTHEQTRTGTFPTWIEALVGREIAFGFACSQRAPIMVLQKLAKDSHAKGGDKQAFVAAVNFEIRRGMCVNMDSARGIVVDIIDSFKAPKVHSTSGKPYWVTVIKVMHPENHEFFLYAGVDLMEPQGV